MTENRKKKSATAAPPKAKSAPSTRTRTDKVSTANNESPSKAASDRSSPPNNEVIEISPSAKAEEVRQPSFSTSAISTHGATSTANATITPENSVTIPISEREEATGGEEAAQSTTISEKAQHTFVNAAVLATKGAIPKTKAAVKQHEFPTNTQSWYDEIEQHQQQHSSQNSVVE